MSRHRRRACRPAGIFKDTSVFGGNSEASAASAVDLVPKSSLDVVALMCERVLPLPAATSAALIATGAVDGDGVTDIVGHAEGTTVTVLRPQ